MKRSTCGLVLVAAIAVCIVSVSGQIPDKPDRFLSALKKNQAVILKEVAGRFEISLMDGVLEPQTHKVVSVDNEFFVVEDIASVSETRIPIYSIKSIVTLKTLKN